MTTAVLVLNASYEPMSSTRLARAVVMVQRGVAVVQEAVPGRYLRFSGGFLPVPKVLRLVRYVKVKIVRHGPATYSRRGVLLRDGGVCAYCANPATTVDHVLPRAQGGLSVWLNTVAACAECNGRKANRTPKQARMTLLVTPFVPTRAQLLGG